MIKKEILSASIVLPPPLFNLYMSYNQCPNLETIYENYIDLMSMAIHM